MEKVLKKLAEKALGRFDFLEQIFYIYPDSFKIPSKSGEELRR